MGEWLKVNELSILEPLFTFKMALMSTFVNIPKMTMKQGAKKNIIGLSNCKR